MTERALALFSNVGPWEILIILGIALLLFGGRKLPELARGLGRGLREFKEELSGAKKEPEKGADGEAGNGGEKPAGSGPKDQSGAADEAGGEKGGATDQDAS